MFLLLCRREYTGRDDIDAQMVAGPDEGNLNIEKRLGRQRIGCTKVSQRPSSKKESLHYRDTELG